MNTPNSVDRHVGKRLRQLRLSRGMDLQELSRRLGVSAPRLLQLEEGRERISANMMLQLSKILDAPPSAFFAGFSTGGETAERVAEPASAQEEEERLLRDFARIRDPKSREIVLALVAAYAEYGDPRT